MTVLTSGTIVKLQFLRGLYVNKGIVIVVLDDLAAFIGLKKPKDSPVIGVDRL